ncbi:MAG: hypothetical protein J3Q66DRAFT_358145 [Benniella sp.]|nr:MAG: hypothetical protein J3Q66DRAFT_358145 [Benniella sp.]
MKAEIIPELRRHIVQYMDFDTLKTFSLVSKACYLDAHPILWEHFSCKVPWKNLTSPEEYIAWLYKIHRNARSFKHIYYMEYDARRPEIGDILLDRCHSLATIEVTVAMIDRWNPYRHWEETLRPLVEQNRVSLRRLKLLVRDIPFVASLQLPSLLSTLSRLQSLELNLEQMPVEDLLPVLDACPSSLEHLDLRPTLRRRKITLEDSVTHPHQSPGTTAASLRLKHLHIHSISHEGTLEDVLSRLAAYTLEELKIDTISNVTYPIQISPTLRDALWQLTDLHLENIHPSPGRGAPLILDAIQPHHLRHVNMSKLDTECTTKLIEQQYGSLESLNVGFLRGHAGALADILATCVKLKKLVFAAKPFVDIQTLIDPQHPWGCTELEVFNGVFGLTRITPSPPPSSDSRGLNDAERSSQVEDQFMQRLGKLTKLRRLVQQVAFVDRSMTAEIDRGTMAWSLSSGLAQLRSLANLKTFMFAHQDLPKGIGVPEMTFIKKHWHGLRILACNEINNSDLEEWLATEWPELKVTLLAK